MRCFAEKFWYQNTGYYFCHFCAFYAVIIVKNYGSKGEKA